MIGILLAATGCTIVSGCAMESGVAGAAAELRRPAQGTVSHGIAIDNPTVYEWEDLDNLTAPRKLAVSGRGEVHTIATLPNGNAAHFHWNGRRWTSQEVPALNSILTDVSVDLGLAVDSQGELHLATATSTGVYYAVRSCRGGWEVEQVSTTLGTVRFALDTASKPHIVQFASSGSLVHYTRGRHGWTATNTGVAHDLSSSLYAGDLEVHGSGNGVVLHLAWGDGGRFNWDTFETSPVSTRYARRSNQGWTVDVLDFGVTLTRPVRPVATFGRNHHTAFIGLPYGALRVVERSASGQFTQLPVPADLSAFGTLSPVFFVDNRGKLHYLNDDMDYRDDDSIFFAGAVWDGSSWSLEEFDSEVNGNVRVTRQDNVVHVVGEIREYFDEDELAGEYDYYYETFHY